MNKFKYAYYALILLMLGVCINHLVVHNVDYPTYELAGQRILQGKVMELYNLKQVGPGGYYYPYFFALIFTVFSYLGFIGKSIFYILMFLSYIKTLNFSVKNALKLIREDGTKYRYLIYTVMVLATTYAINDNFLTGNIAVFLLALCIYAYELRERHPMIAGAIMAVAIVFKIYPLFILCFFIWDKRWKVVISSILIAVFLYIGVPLIANGYDVGLALLRNQYIMLSDYNSHYAFSTPADPNIVSPVLRIFPNLGIKYILAPALLAVLIGFLPSFLKNRTELKGSFRSKMFILVLALTTILTPISWYNMMLFYSPLIAYILSLAIIKKDKISAISFLGYFILFCLTTPGIVGNKVNDILEFYAVPLIGLLIVLFGYLARFKHYDEDVSL